MATRFLKPETIPSKRTVFLVEDSADDRRFIIRALKSSPYVGKIHWFKSADRMLKYFSYDKHYDAFLNKEPFLILIDLNIPGTSSLEVLRQLKENEVTSYIPTAVLTGSNSAFHRERAFRLRANAYIAKPLKLGHLHDVMLTGRSWPPVWAVK